MQRTLRRLLAAGPNVLLVLGFAAAVLFGERGCARGTGDPTWPVAGDGVSITRYVTTGGRHGAPGDWILASKRIEVMIADDVGSMGAHPRDGTVLAVKPGSGEAGPLRALGNMVWVGGREYELETQTVAPDTTQRAPRLAIQQRVVGLPLVLTTLLTLGREDPWFELVTSVENRGRTPIRGVALGDRLAWPGAATFAPRVGFAEEPLTASVRWMARLGHRYAYALAYPDGPFEVTFEFDRVGPTQQTAMVRPMTLGPGARFEHRRILMAVRGGMAEVAELAWPAVSRPIGYVEGQLQPPPSWALVRALHADGQPVLEVSADASGRYSLPLPEGTYRLVLECPGGIDEQSVDVDPTGPPVRGLLIPPAPGRLRFSAVDDGGRALPVRWLIRGVPPTPSPDFGPDERIDGAKNAVYTANGSGEVELAPGTYRVLATHGPEWSVAEQDVTIAVDVGRAVRAQLVRQVLTPGWISADFHVHAAPSPDSSVALEDRVTALIAEGVEFAAATDHNHTTDYGPTIVSLGAVKDLVAVPGIEVTTKDWGHFNAYPYPVDAGVPPYESLTASGIFAGIRQRAPDAVVQVNHPNMKHIGYFIHGDLDVPHGVYRRPGFDLGFDALEVVNGFELDEPGVLAQNLADWFGLLNRGFRFTAVGNSDSHRLVYQWAGYPRTYVRVSTDEAGTVDAAEVIASLRAGHAIISAGPFVSVLVDGVAGPGDLVTTQADGPVLEVSVRAADWVDVTRAEVWVNGEVVAQRRAPGIARRPVRLEWQLPLALERDSWVVVVVRGEKRLDRVLPGIAAAPLAITNPIYVDVDGDGECRPLHEIPLRLEDRPDNVQEELSTSPLTGD